PPAPSRFPTRRSSDLEIIGASFHHQSINTNYLGVSLQYRLGNKVLARGIGVNDGANQRPGHVGIISEQLLSILWQAVAAIAKARSEEHTPELQSREKL